MSTVGEASGTVVVHDRHVAYVTEGVARLCGRSVHDLVGQPYLDLVLPEERARVGDRYERLQAGEQVPAEFETALVGPGGEPVPVECRMALDGRDLLVQVQDASARVARRPRLAALAALGTAIQRERGEPAVLSRVREGLSEAGLHSVLMRAEGESVRIEWAALPEEARLAFQARLGKEMPGFQGSWSPFARRIWAEGAVYTDDWGSAASRLVSADVALEVRRFATALGLSRAIGVRLDERSAARFYLVLLGDWLRPEDVTAARLFGAQVASALDAARTISDLSQRNADLAALARLGALAGDAEDPAAFFAAAFEVVRGVVACDALAVWAVDEPTGDLVLLHGAGGTAAGRRAYTRLPASDPLARVLQARMPVTAEAGDPGPFGPSVETSGMASGIWVPLFAHSRAEGALAAGFLSAGTAPAHVEVLVAAAAHFAGALASHRLLKSLRGRVAELTALHGDLERAQAKLLQRERLAALGELSAVVAHEVRNPLGVIFNSIGSLRRLLRPDGDIRLLLDIVGEEAERLNRIVGDLLDFARPSTPLLRPGSLRRVTEEAVASAVGNVPGVEVRCTFDPDLPPVPMDEQLVRQVVVNLAENAAQAMPHGGRLDVRVRRDGQAAVLEVEDHGPGIPDDIRARIFEPFFTTKASGTGLGLAVVRRIVEGHSAELTLAPGREGGTLFAVRFPLAAEVETASPPDGGSAP